MSLKKKRPAQFVKRMMNLLFELDSKEEMLKKLNRFCEHRDFYFIGVERKKKRQKPTRDEFLYWR